MKSVYLLIFTLFLSCSFSYSQVTSFTGKIVDERNEPVSGAHIRIIKKGFMVEKVTDADGEFEISQMLAGDYFADINANGRVVRAKKLYVQPEGRVKIYYNFKLFARGVTVSIMSRNRLMADKL